VWPAAAQDTFPNRPLTFIVPYSAGGPSDFIARVFAERVGKYLGQSVIVDNRPGAAGAIAIQQLMRAPADGYTLFAGSLGTQVLYDLVSRARNRPLNYNARTDMMPVSIIASYPMVLNVSLKTGAGSFREFVDIARSNPGKLSFGSDGVGSLPHLAAEMLNQALGIEAISIQYKGSAETATALSAGFIDYSFAVLLPSLNTQKAGKSKILAVAGPQRNHLLPGVPTLTELGYQGFTFESWTGTFVREGTPKSRIDALSAAFRKAAEAPELKSRFAATGTDARGSTAEAFAEIINADYQRWGQVLKSAKNIKFVD